LAVLLLKRGEERWLAMVLSFGVTEVPLAAMKAIAFVAVF